MVTPPRVSKQEAKFFAPEQTRTFLTAIEGDRMAGFYIVVITLSLRRGEALAQKWEDVDFESKNLHIMHTLQRIEGKLQLADLKTSKSRRTIHLPEVTMEALRTHRKNQIEEKLAAGIGGRVRMNCVRTPITAGWATK